MPPSTLPPSRRPRRTRLRVARLLVQMARVQVAQGRQLDELTRLFAALVAHIAPETITHPPARPSRRYGKGAPRG